MGADEAEIRDGRRMDSARMCHQWHIDVDANGEGRDGAVAEQRS